METIFDFLYFYSLCHPVLNFDRVFMRKDVERRYHTLLKMNNFCFEKKIIGPINVLELGIQNVRSNILIFSRFYDKGRIPTNIQKRYFFQKKTSFYQCFFSILCPSVANIFLCIYFHILSYFLDRYEAFYSIHSNKFLIVTIYSVRPVSGLPSERSLLK